MICPTDNQSVDVDCRIKNATAIRHHSADPLASRRAPARLALLTGRGAGAMESYGGAVPPRYSLEVPAMKQYPPERLRNVVLLSHGGAGKTSLAEAMLYTAKATTRLGRVEEGNTVSDWDPDEVKRHISISTSVLPIEWRDHKINLLDAPGYADFVGEIKSALRAADAAVIVLCAASGVEVGSEQVWTYL